MSLTISPYQIDVCGEDQIALDKRMEKKALNTVITPSRLIINIRWQCCQMHFNRKISLFFEQHKVKLLAGTCGKHKYGI